MLTVEQITMFHRIAKSEPQFAAWLFDELQKQVNVLIQNRDKVVLRRAQGSAQILQTILSNLEQSKGNP
jgi:hypothetical protein